MYDKKSIDDKKMLEKLKKEMSVYAAESLAPSDMGDDDNTELALMLAKELQSPLTRRNKVKLLINGEEKFPEVLQVILDANHRK